jgi:anti-anti-sigma factor
LTCEMHNRRGTRQSGEAGQHASIVLSGEIDVAEAPVVADRLAELGDPHGDLVVDAAHLSFIDVAGCRVLLEAAERLAGNARLVVMRPPACLVTVMAACGWADHPRVVLLAEPAR